MIGKGYLSILFIVTTIVVLSNINANAQISGKWSADLQPRKGSNATGTATLELQNNGQNVQYDVTGSGLSNVTGVVLSQVMGSGRTPDVVTLKTASQSGLGPGDKNLSGNFTVSDLMGPLNGKGMADFEKAIIDGKIIFRVNTMAFPLGEIIGNVTAGAGNATAGAGNATAGAGNATAGAGNATAGAGNATAGAGNATAGAGNATAGAGNATAGAGNATAAATRRGNATAGAGNATAGAGIATGAAMGEAKDTLSTAYNATANATGTAWVKQKMLLAQLQTPQLMQQEQH